jgi:hypothetical protein
LARDIQEISPGFFFWDIAMAWQQYLISRTSHISGKPCEEAYRVDVDGTDEIWAVSLSESQLLRFIDKYGTCVIGKDLNGSWSIEIYDELLG